MREKNAMPADSVVRARIDSTTKKRASAALAAMGLSISDAIRLLMLRIADEQRLPFAVKVPNAVTRRATAELEQGKGKRFASADALLEDLGI
jgi:DNA-damage-inducible protein J